MLQEEIEALSNNLAEELKNGGHSPEEIKEYAEQVLESKLVDKNFIKQAPQAEVKTDDEKKRDAITAANEKQNELFESYDRYENLPPHMQRERINPYTGFGDWKSSILQNKDLTLEQKHEIIKAEEAKRAAAAKQMKQQMGR